MARKWAVVLAAVICGCAEAPPQVIRVDDPRVTAVIIAGPNTVQSHCDTGGTNDHGGKIVAGDVIGGCYFPPFGPIWISNTQDIALVLNHELCHAITGLPSSTCEYLWSPTRFSWPSENVGGKR